MLQHRRRKTGPYQQRRRTTASARRDEKNTQRYENRNSKKLPTEPRQTLRRLQRLPFAKQNEKLGGVPGYTENNKKKIVNIVFYRKARTVSWKRITRGNQQTVIYVQYSRRSKTIVKYETTTQNSRIQPVSSEGGNVRCTGQTANHKLKHCHSLRVV